MFNASDLHQKYSSIAVANNSQAHLRSPFEKKVESKNDSHDNGTRRRGKEQRLQNSKQLERLEQTVEKVGKSRQTGYQSGPAKDSVPKDTKGN
jgi:hypothetical protein